MPVWSVTTLPSTCCWGPIAYGSTPAGDMFVVLSQSTAEYATSTDGYYWTLGTLPSSYHWVGLAAGNNMFVAVADFTHSATFDGTTWTIYSGMSSNEPLNVCFGASGAGVWVAPADNYSYTSSDGITWTFNQFNRGRIVGAMAYGAGLFVGAPAIGSYWQYSATGSSWQTPVTQTSATLNCVAWSSTLGMFVAMGDNSDPPFTGTYYYTSTNGIAWTQRSTGLPYGCINGVVYGSGKFMSVQSASRGTNGYFGPSFGGSVAIYGSNNSGYSTDGLTWTQASLPFVGLWNYIAYGVGVFVAIANQTTNLAAFYGTPPALRSGDNLLPFFM